MIAEAQGPDRQEGASAARPYNRSDRRAIACDVVAEDAKIREWVAHVETQPLSQSLNRYQR